MGPATLGGVAVVLYNLQVPLLCLLLVTLWPSAASARGGVPACHVPGNWTPYGPR